MVWDRRAPAVRWLTAGGRACVLLIFASTAACQDYKPEPGYGPFDRFAKANRQIVANVARQIELPPDLLLAVAASESGFSSKARSDRGAVGIMQVMPATAHETADEIGLENLSLEDPVQNTLLGGLYLKKMLKRYGGDVPLALAAYNAGPGNVDLWISRSAKNAGGADIVRRKAFRQTRGYIHDVLRRAGEGALGPWRHQVGVVATNEVVGRYACMVGDDDTLYSVARRNGIAIRDLWRLNLQRMDVAGDGTFLTSGQTVWLRPLPTWLECARTAMGNLRAADVALTVNTARHCLELAVSGTVIRRYEMALDNRIGGERPHGQEGHIPAGDYYVCRKITRAPYGKCLQLSYPNENDAWNALLQDRITTDE
ncbi:MAG: transglycosylase SLT domain-containing protein, partial [bacterium]